MRPAHPRSALVAPLVASILMAIGPASSAAAADDGGWTSNLALPTWSGSRAEDVTAKSVDALIVRPIATARVVLGALLFVPAAIISSPMGKEGFDGAYDTLIDIPFEYAFKRDIGDL